MLLGVPKRGFGSHPCRVVSSSYQKIVHCYADYAPHVVDHDWLRRCRSTSGLGIEHPMGPRQHQPRRAPVRESSPRMSTRWLLTPLVAQPAERTQEAHETGDMKLGRRKPTETQSVQQLSRALEPGHSENAENLSCGDCPSRALLSDLLRHRQAF